MSRQKVRDIPGRYVAVTEWHEDSPGMERYLYTAPTHWSDAIAELRRSKHRGSEDGWAYSYGSGGFNGGFQPHEYADAVATAHRAAADRLVALRPELANEERVVVTMETGLLGRVHSDAPVRVISVDLDDGERLAETTIDELLAGTDTPGSKVMVDASIAFTRQVFDGTPVSHKLYAAMNREQDRPPAAADLGPDAPRVLVVLYGGLLEAVLCDRDARVFRFDHRDRDGLGAALTGQKIAGDPAALDDKLAEVRQVLEHRLGAGRGFR